jgi:ApaG protein
MVIATTAGIKVSVQVKYEGYISARRKYAFSYIVNIQNTSSSTVQLLRRHWFIKDSTGDSREVEGEGVIGQQPILEPNQSHEYTSWSPLDSEIGIMYGTFLMQNISTEELFDVEVPLFKMVTPARAN